MRYLLNANHWIVPPKMRCPPLVATLAATPPEDV